MEMARCIRNSKNLAKYFWVEAINTIVYLLNRSPTKAVYGITPEEVWTGEKPNIDHLCIFRCVAYAHVPDENRTKLEDKSVKCIRIGYSEVSKAYKLFNPKKRRIILNRDVVFDEKKVYEDVINDKIKKDKDITIYKQRKRDRNPKYSNCRRSRVIKFWTTKVFKVGPVRSNQKNMLDTNFNRRMTRQQSLVNFVLMTRVMKNNEPQSFDEEVNKVQWQNAMEAEFDALVRNYTWTLMELPLDKDVIETKKYKSDGSINKHKVRLVAKGNAQQEGIDYTETFSLVVKDTIRTVLVLVAQHGWIIYQMYVKTTFLHGDLEEEIYMQQPQGYEVKGKEKFVCRLKKSLYGLKQAPRQWYLKFGRFMTEQGYSRCHSDH
eukprot:Gb_04138 [translate_table: standard]